VLALSNRNEAGYINGVIDQLKVWTRNSQ